MKRRPDVSREEFHRYWREHHGPLFCENAAARRYVVRYEQIHAVIENDELGADDFDGVSVMWFNVVADLIAMRAHPAYAEVVSDGHNFIDMTNAKVLLSDAEEVFDVRT